MKRFDSGLLVVEVYPDKASMGVAAAEKTIHYLNEVVEENGEANVVWATGNSMLAFYEALVERKDAVDWSKVRVFHMDEYVGMDEHHPASFRRFLHEKVVDAIKPMMFYGVIGDAEDIQAECERYANLLKMYPTDLCCLGIGENGHLAFNDPPFADFDDPKWVKVVALAEKSRQQQVGEGHFPSLDSVPREAITITIPGLLAAKRVLGIVPERRKAEAVYAALRGPVTEDCPASLLQTCDHATLLIDEDSASLMR
ncbi:MAG: glucosamine-6-phosphate deaminase [Anaerolineaceae bacterium]|nr:glucosamine-6-phosphate deaminase [Anaerolineaceae bacterium]